jgi:hypothetical protein
VTKSRVEVSYTIERIGSVKLSDCNGISTH